MMGRSTSFVGLAFAADQTIACAEVSVVGGRATVLHAVTFTFPEGSSLETPSPAGQALSAFLRQNKFGSSRAVVGVPARWLIAVEKDLPPADNSTAQAALRLQAERLAVAESGEMVFDFAGNPERNAATKVLLVGIHRKQLQQVQKVMDAAGLSIVAVTSTSLAISAAVLADGGEADTASGGVLAINRGGAELVWRASGSPRMLRYLPMSVNGSEAPAMGPMTTELRRIVAMSGSNGSAGAKTLHLVDSIGLEPQQLTDLSGRLGVTVKSSPARELLGVESILPTGAETTPAIALALMAAKDQLPLDFEHSSLTPAPPRRFGKRSLWIGSAVVVALAVLIWLLVAESKRQSKLDSLTAQLDAKKDDITSAKSARDRLNIGRSYFPDGRPSAIDCLREVTQVFRTDEKIWTTTFSIHDNGKCVLSGKAADLKTGQRLVEGLIQSGKFTDVHALDMREADTRSGEVTFSIGFNYNGVR